MSVTKFVDKNYKHFNAATLRDAAIAYKKHMEGGGGMLMTLAGAMSTAELGISLAEMIRKDLVTAICCTGANLEEDLFNLLAHKHYKRIPDYRNLTPEDEQKLFKTHMNRVTDTCIPENEAFRKVEKYLLPLWQDCQGIGLSYFPHEYLYSILLNNIPKSEYQIDPKNSWLLAAARKNLPIFVPGWEDSTLGNIFASQCYKGQLSPSTVRGGIEYMVNLMWWYNRVSQERDIGFFQIGGGIAGDFPICVVPTFTQELQIKVPLWGYFCQISDSTTSYGSYSGAQPEEKITWGKLSPKTPKFMIESDATIVVPLMFNYIMGK